MSLRWTSVVVLMVTALTASADPAVDRRTVGGLTFTLPAGWKFDLPAGQDHAGLVYADAKRYCIISLYQPINSDNIEIDFLREWKAVAGAVKDQKPNPTRRKVGGRDVIEANGATPANDGTVLFERVSVMGGDGQMTAMVVLTATEATSRDCKADSDGIYASVKFTNGTPAPTTTAPVPAPATPAPATPAPAPATNVLLGTLKPSVTLADLAGKWTYGASAATYYQTANGDHAGVTASYANMSYTIRANGTYEYTESGLSNGSRFSDTDTGTVTLSAGSLVLKNKAGRARTLQLIAFMTLPNASVVLTTYAEYQNADAPLDAAAVAKQCYTRDGMFQCREGEMWSRAAPPAKK